MKKIYTLAMSFFLLAGIKTYAQQIVFVTVGNSIGIIANPSAPNIVIGPFPVSGLSSGQNIEGIDYRPNTGELYALGYNSATQEARLYTISTTGTATAIGTAPVMLDLEAGKIGFDFNPTVDRIRVISANGSNYRLHPVTGAIAATDGDLAFAATDVNSASTPMAVSAAYSKSYIGTESTTLYNIDFDLNILTTQIPPNNGTQNTVGSLGISIDDNTPTVGFDLYHNGTSEIGYVSANEQGSTNDNLYTVDLANGTLTSLGAIGLGLDVRDIAVVIDRTLPAITGVEVFALSQNASGVGNLISFDSDNPGLVRTWKPVTGVTAGQSLLGMDFRPATKELFAFGYDATLMNYQLYTINTASGAATAVNAAAVSLPLDTALVGFDFNPTVDRIRLVGAGGENYRLNPNDGAIAATDGDLAYASGDMNNGTMPFVATVAYTNSFSGATSTTLYGYDDMLNVLLTVVPPNDGVCNTQASSGIMTGMASYTSDMDIYFDSLAYENKLFFATNVGGSTDDFFYTITNNMFTQVGKIGYGIPVKDIAIGIGGTPFDLDVNENQYTSAPTVFPNPAMETVYLQIETGVGQRFDIIDLTGRVVLSTQLINSSNQPVDVSGLKSGMYYIRLESGKSLPFIKQ